MTLSLAPVWIVDLLGSASMILFSFICVTLTFRIRRQDRENVVWIYLQWMCLALAGFAISRGVGHIAKHVLILNGHGDIWNDLRPYSGAVNTIMFAVVASITLFFERVWRIYQQVLRDRAALQEAHRQLVFMNRHLEDLVGERTLELARSETKYRRIFEVSRDTIAVVLPSGIIQDINPAGLAMLGLTLPEVHEGHVSFAEFFVRKEDWERLKNQLMEASYINDAEVDLLTREGKEVSVLLSAAAQCLFPEKVETFHFVLKDISQRKAMQRQLLQADKLASIGQLAAGIAHEINNPLSIILGYTQLLIRDEEENTERYLDLRTIEKHTRACKTIVEDLLSFSRTTHTKKEETSLHGVIEDVLNVVRHHLDMDQVDLVKDFDPSVPPMVLDRDKIQQVFMNLIMNAKQAVRSAGSITVRTCFDAEKSMVFVDVEDTGCGIPARYLTKIFDPFFTTKGTGEGTGLGLSVSYGIVQNHGGEILVESEEGIGTRFRVVLPVGQKKG